VAILPLAAIAASFAAAVTFALSFAAGAATGAAADVNFAAAGGGADAGGGGADAAVVVADVADAAASGTTVGDAADTAVADALAAALFPDLLTRIVTGAPLLEPLAFSFWHLTADISLYYLPQKKHAPDSYNPSPINPPSQ